MIFETISAVRRRTCTSRWVCAAVATGKQDGIELRKLPVDQAEAMADRQCIGRDRPAHHKCQRAAKKYLANCQSDPGLKTKHAEAAAAAVGVSERTCTDYLRILESKNEALIASVDSGDIAIHAAVKTARHRITTSCWNRSNAGAASPWQACRKHTTGERQSSTGDLWGHATCPHRSRFVRRTNHAP